MIRAEQGVSQRQAAFRCGVTPRVWQGMEEGRNTAGLLDVLRTIASEFGYDLDWLTWGGPLKTNDPHRGGPGGGQHVPPVGLEPTTCGLIGERFTPSDRGVVRELRPAA